MLVIGLENVPTDWFQFVVAQAATSYPKIHTWKMQYIAQNYIQKLARASADFCYKTPPQV